MKLMLYFNELDYNVIEVKLNATTIGYIREWQPNYYFFDHEYQEGMSDSYWWQLVSLSNTSIRETNGTVDAVKDFIFNGLRRQQA